MSRRRRVLHRVGVDVVGAGVVGLLAGVSAALFLAGLAAVTALRDARAVVLVPLLPIAAALLLEVTSRMGRAAGGTTVVLEVATRGTGAPVPRALFLVALVGTWWTHLFGGSAGREGTAVQMGAAIADTIVHGLRRLLPTVTLEDDDRRHLIVAGIAGGFAGVFGTPIAAAVFGVEVVVARRLDPRVAVAAVVAAFSGDVVGDAALHLLGGAHGHYPTLAALAVTPSLLLRFAVLGLLVGGAGRAFVALLHGVKRGAAGHAPWLRGGVAGVVVVAIWAVVPGADGLVGLSVPILEAAARGDVAAVVPQAFAVKLVLTAVTIGVGLVGGEVTPLFVIGATLGVVVAGPLGLPPEQAACAALAAMFGACAVTPIALLCMIVELCGAGAVVHQAVCMLVATVVVGRHGIYTRPDPTAPPPKTMTTTTTTTPAS